MDWRHPSTGATSAYEGVDALESFSSASELSAYRCGLLERSTEELEFIRTHVGQRDLRVLEVGAGSGRLLVALALAGMLRAGVGIDLARSRIEFAGRWAADLGLASLRFQQGDMREAASWPAEHFDLVLGLNHVLGFLDPAAPAALATFAGRLCARLAATGCVLLESYQLPPVREQILRLSGNRLRVWKPLPPPDRFAYYLSDFTYDPLRRVLTHEKTFVARDGTIDTGRVEENVYFGAAVIVRALRDAGCTRVRAFGDFAGSPYEEESSQQLVLLAGGPAWSPAAGSGWGGHGARRSPGRHDGPGAWV